MIPIIRHSRKGKTIATVKRLVIGQGTILYDIVMMKTLDYTFAQTYRTSQHNVQTLKCEQIKPYYLRGQGIPRWNEKATIYIHYKRMKQPYYRG